MKKGVEALSLIAGLIILLIVIVVLWQFTKVTAQSLDRTANVNEVRLWALTQAQQQKFSTERAGKEHPPVANLGGPIVIADENQLKKSHKQIADGMYDCWSAFNKGETNFLQAVKGATFCYPCVEIRIDDSLKNKGYKLVGLNSFIAKNKPRGGTNMPTYLEYLTGEKDIPVGVKDEFDVNDDMYIFFVASGGRSTWELIKSVAVGVDEDDNAMEDVLRGAVTTAGAEGKLIHSYYKAKGFEELAKLQQDENYQALKKEIGSLEKQMDDLDKEILKLRGEGKGVAEKVQEQKGVLQKIASSQKKMGGLEEVALKNGKTVVSTASLPEGEIPKDLTGEFEAIDVRMKRLQEGIKRADLGSAEKNVLEERVERYAARNARLEANVAKVTTKATVEVGEKALVVTSEAATLELEKGLVKKGVTRLAKKTFAKGVVRFVPLVGQAIAVGDVVYTGYKIVMGNRKFSATVMIDDAEHLKAVCNPEIREEQQADAAAARNGENARELRGRLQ